MPQLSLSYLANKKDVIICVPRGYGENYSLSFSLSFLNCLIPLLTHSLSCSIPAPLLYSSAPSGSIHIPMPSPALSAHTSDALGIVNRWQSTDAAEV